MQSIGLNLHEKTHSDYIGLIHKSYFDYCIFSTVNLNTANKGSLREVDVSHSQPHNKLLRLKYKSNIQCGQRLTLKTDFLFEPCFKTRCSLTCPLNILFIIKIGICISFWHNTKRSLSLVKTADGLLTYRWSNHWTKSWYWPTLSIVAIVICLETINWNWSQKKF